MRDWLSPQLPGLRLLLIVLLAIAAGFVFGVRWAASYDTSDHRRYLPPVPPDLAFEPFPLPSPTPIAGLHDYAVPQRPAPTAAPTPAKASRPTSGPAAGHPVEGSARRATRHALDGKASWHATGRSGLYAAACRPLRLAMGQGWRGRTVLVAYGRRAVEVTLNDWCGSRDKTIDLSDEAFRYFAPLSRGVLRVTVGW